MAFTNLSTRSTGYLVTATNWNEMVNNWLAVATSAGLLKHEFGGMEFNASAITTGGIVRGASSGVMSILANFLDGSGRVKHEMGGIEADISAIAAGGLLKGSGTGSMGILARGSASQILRVNSGGSDLEFASVVAPSLAVKAADETVTSSTSLQNDDALVVALGASTDYAILMYLELTTNTAADFKYTFTTPSSPTRVGNGMFLYGADGRPQTKHDGSYGDPHLTALTSTETFEVATTAATGMAYFSSIRNGSNAGNLQFQWAQNTSNGSGTTVSAGSWLCAIPVP